MFYLLDALFMNYYGGREREREWIILFARKKKLDQFVKNLESSRSINFVDNWKKYIYYLPFLLWKNFLI